MRKSYVAALILMGLVAILLFAAVSGMGRKNVSTVLDVDGDQFTVSVYRFPEPLRIPVLYEPGVLQEELASYPWLKAFLFTLTGVEAYIPRNEWSQYADYAWNEKVYRSIEKMCAVRRENVLVKQKERWAGAYYTLSAVVLCEDSKRKALSAYMKEILSDGTSSGGLYNKVAYCDGRWKRVAADDGGRYAKQLMDCHAKAMKLVDEGSLKTKPIGKLR